MDRLSYSRLPVALSRQPRSKKNPLYVHENRTNQNTRDLFYESRDCTRLLFLSEMHWIPHFPPPRDGGLSLLECNPREQRVAHKSQGLRRI